MALASLVFALDRTASQPIFAQLCGAIRTRIRGGDLLPGARLPATRALAADLGIARATVVSAYEQLVAEGYLEARQGSGFWVCALAAVDLPPRSATAEAAQVPQAPYLPQEQEAERSPLLLEPGRADMRLFPHRSWGQAVARICRRRPEALLEDCGVQGHPDLRAAIAAHVRDWRGLSAAPSQVIVTSGAANALDICLRALPTPIGALAIEDPGYPPIHRLAQGLGISVQHLDIDEQGAVLPTGTQASAGQGEGGAVMLTPSHQFPLGGAMSAGRRQAFIAWASQNDAWILEDDYDSEFRYAGRPIPAMAGADTQGRTIYIGSFSKIFSDGLRLGYIVAPAALVSDLLQAMRSLGQRAAAMAQVPLAEFMRSGEFYRHLRRVRRVYAERHRAMIAALRSDFSDVGHVVDHQAGMQVVLHLVAGLDDRRIAEAAHALGLGIDPLSRFCLRPGLSKGLLLGASLNDVEEQVHALQLLRQAIAATQ